LSYVISICKNAFDFSHTAHRLKISSTKLTFSLWLIYQLPLILI